MGVLLGEMLAAREWRAARRGSHLDAMRGSGKALITLTLNIAGADKRPALSGKAFALAKEMISERLSGVLLEERIDGAGHCAFLSAEGDALKIKVMLCEMERGLPIGALFDFDLHGADGVRIGREAVGEGPRRCLVCESEAHACARSRAHPLQEVQAATAALLLGHFGPPFADSIQGAALRGLLYELAATPKPGLVDRRNEGAHADMDFFTFIDSVSAIAPHLRACVVCGMHHDDDAALLAALRAIGIAAERDMMAATRGVNAHRGAIFALGLLGAACGRNYVRDLGLSPEKIARTAGRIGALFEGERPDEAVSHGDRVHARSGMRGARGEAADGFPSVISIALPAIADYLARGASVNEASVGALLHLIAQVGDTNLFFRAGDAGAAAIQAQVRAHIDTTQKDIAGMMACAGELDALFVARHISPGGCADLLAAAWMLHFVARQFPECGLC